MKQGFGTLALGVALGFALSRIGFSSSTEVHGMFTFQNPRLLATFALGVVLLGVVWRAVRAASTAPPRLTPRNIHPGSAIGGLLFGIGWALGGACPGVALVQLGEGQLAAGVTLIGIFSGNWLYAAAHERFFRWSSRSCLDD